MSAFETQHFKTEPFNAAAIAQEYKDYAYTVSHDLGAPARSIIEFSRLLQSEQADNLSDEARLYLSMVLDSGQRLQNMLAGLLAFSRLNTQAKPFAPADTKAIVDAVLANFSDHITARNAKITHGDMPIIMADKDQITQLFTALIDNALKFTPKDRPPQVEISSRTRPEFWEFTIQDNGIGIEEKFHERIFQIFRRLHTEDEYPGTGVGLTLAKKIIERHGGTIWITPSEKGTMLHFAISRMLTL